MINKKLSKAMAVVLTTATLAGSFSPNMSVQAAVEETVNTEQNQTTEYSNERIENNYTIVSAGYTLEEYTGVNVEYSMADIFTGGSAVLTSDNYGYDKKCDVISAKTGDDIELTLNVEKDGIYYLKFDYCALGSTILPAEVDLMVNGEYPFYETRRLLFESLWASASEKSYDRYGNEIVSIPDKLEAWQSKYLMDASYRYMEPLGIELKAGENTFTMTVSEGEILFGNLSLCPKEETTAYAGSETAAGNSFITIEAEEFTYRNDSSIRGMCEYDPDLYPYEIKNKTLNTIDGTSFKDAGQKITYEFTAPKSGYYNIAVNYCQSTKSDFPVFMNLDIDGVVPNTEFENYAFAYVKNYDLLTLKDAEGNNLTVYLEEGTHTISMTISLEPLRYVLERIDYIMNEVNSLSLEVTKVAGTNKDKYRDFDLEAYLPGIGDRLTSWADELDSLAESCKIYVGDIKRIGAFSSVSIASKQLRSLAEDPDELLYRIDELATGTSSVNAHLANLIDTLNGNDISIDRIFLYQDDAKSELPEKTGFFTRIWLSIKRFFSSFAEQAYSTSNTDPDHLQVWVNRPRQYLEIMQKMIDEEFTPVTGIEVDLSLMPDQNKLVLANASGDSPDIATGINYSVPFDLAIRGALKDLTEFDDFAEIASRYKEALLVPSTIENSIYSLPETMNFWVLFYRSDVLDRLGLEVPDTMDEVIGMLTDLQMRGLNFYYPTAGMVAMKNFHGTTPLLFQNGATLYSQYAGDTAINSEEAVEGFTMLTELFTIYNLPKDIPNFYQHFRNGDLPIGIADFGTYNLILNAAPEIASSWEIALIPGTVAEDGTVLRYSSGGAESTVMFESDDKREAQAWEFMKWWSSADVQAEFGQTLQVTYGDEYLWNSANTEAFAQLPWRSQDKEVILGQNEWLLEAPRILGTYMLERELSNAYNSVVVDGESIRITLDKAVKTVNRETQRKLEEFGYMDGDTVLKEYEVPTVETVRRILGITD